MSLPIESSTIGKLISRNGSTRYEKRVVQAVYKANQVSIQVDAYENCNGFYLCTILACLTDDAAEQVTTEYAIDDRVACQTTVSFHHRGGSNNSELCFICRRALQAEGVLLLTFRFISSFKFLAVFLLFRLKHSRIAP